jgi:SAM-dependent methyltransferase
VQLRNSFDLKEMYGDNYGYRSSLNQSMVEHLRAKVAHLRTIVSPGPRSLVIDIGSNDGTLLSFYPQDSALLAGIDPTAAKFRAFYRPDIQVLPDFFSAAAVRAAFGTRKADIITSIAMFYDLEDPIAFVRQIADVLADHGIWHFEQSYLPTMLKLTSYDTICHEHLEYYALRQIEWALARAGLRIIDVSINAINGGSFAITAAHQNSSHKAADGVARALAQEKLLGLDQADIYQQFANRTTAHRRDLLDLLSRLRRENALVLGYGASTKGNVILQYCGLTPTELPFIAEVNKDKFGCYCPGTHIPIISEDEAHAKNPAYFLVLPWHFRPNLIAREQAFLARGGKMIFPLPAIETVPS